MSSWASFFPRQPERLTTIGQPRNGVALKLSLRNFAALGSRHQVLRHAVCRIAIDDLPHLSNSARCIASRGQCHQPVAHTGLRVGFIEAELRGQRLTRRNHAVEIRALACQYVHQNLYCRVVGRISARHTVGDKSKNVGQVAVEGESV